MATRPPVREVISLMGWLLQEGGFLFLFRRSSWEAAKSEIPLRSQPQRLCSAHSVNSAVSTSERWGLIPESRSGIGASGSRRC